MTTRLVDPLDQASDYADRHNAEALATHRARREDGEQLKDEDGTVLCIDCADPVPVRRLNAVPYALRCVDCQYRHDLTHEG